jgi:hypothetical protein
MKLLKKSLLILTAILGIAGSGRVWAQTEEKDVPMTITVLEERRVGKVSR